MGLHQSLRHLQREQLGEEEFFFEKYGYSYDWVFVFPIGEEPDSEAFQVLVLVLAQERASFLACHWAGLTRF